MSGSVCVFPILPDSALGKPTQFIQHQGSSINPKRQSGPHAHSLIFDKSNRFAFVPDLGMDKLMVYKTDFDKGLLSPAKVPFVSVQPGAGPRHCVFHPSGRYCYLIQELDSTLSAYRYNQNDGTFELLQTVPTDNIVVFRIDPETGTLSEVDQAAVPTPVCVRALRGAGCQLRTQGTHYGSEA